MLQDGCPEAVRRPAPAGTRGLLEGGDRGVCVPPSAATPFSPPPWPGQGGQRGLGGVPDAHVEEVIPGGTAQQVPQGEAVGQELREVLGGVGGQCLGRWGGLPCSHQAGPDPQPPRSSVCHVATGLTVAVVAVSVPCRCSHSRRRGSALPRSGWGLGGEPYCPGAKHPGGASPCSPLRWGRLGTVVASSLERSACCISRCHSCSFSASSWSSLGESRAQTGTGGGGHSVAAGDMETQGPVKPLPARLRAEVAELCHQRRGWL